MAKGTIVHNTSENTKRQYGCQETTPFKNPKAQNIIEQVPEERHQEMWRSKSPNRHMRG